MYGGIDIDLESNIDGKIFKRIEDGKLVIVVDKPSNVTLPIFLSTWGDEQPTAGKFQIKIIENSIELRIPKGITFKSAPESLVIKDNERGNKTAYLQIVVTDDAKFGKYEIPFELIWEEDKESSGRGFSIILNVGKDFGPDVIPDNKLSPWSLSPLKQFKSGILALDVRCKEGMILVTKAGDNSPACVLPLTFNKLVERGWANSKLSETFYVFVDDTRYEIPYHVTGWKNKVLNMTADLESNSLTVDIQTKNNGELTVTIPKTLLDANIIQEQDTIFFVLIDGEESAIKNEKKTDVDSTLTIGFPEGAKKIEIIGATLI